MRAIKRRKALRKSELPHILVITYLLFQTGAAIASFLQGEMRFASALLDPGS